MSSEHVSLLALAVSLLGTLVVSTWRFSSVAATLLESIRHLQKKNDDTDVRLKALDLVPQIETRVSFLEKNYASVNRLTNDVEVLKAQFVHFKEVHSPVHTQKPDS
jgi:hypothetical protein